MKKYWVAPIIPFVIYLLIPVPRGWIWDEGFSSLRIFDRNGVLLREVLSSQEAVSRWVPLSQVSSWLLKATIHAEDKRFYRHPGIDPFATLRAGWQNLKHRTIVSGGSTITQQLVRSLHGWKKRNLFFKIVEAFEALRLELHLSKDEILEAYLNRTCYGNQAYGISAASWLYFRKPSSHLSLAESAFLASIPRAPTLYNPYRSQAGSVKRKDELLEVMWRRGEITERECLFARNESIRMVPRESNFKAPHFTDWVLQSLSELGVRDVVVVRTTLDYSLQERLAQVLEDELALLKKHRVTNGALLVMNTKTGEIYSMIGSRDFFDAQHDGQVNGTVSPRQPGSALKPFTYGVVLEDRLMSPSTIIPDIETYARESSGDFFPRNYDREYHGPVTLRTSLACSYNVPAVRVLERIGPDRLLKKLRQAGFASLEMDARYYGLGLTLGDGEVTLKELANGYRTMGCGGVWQEEQPFLQLEGDRGIPLELPERQESRVFSSQVCYIVTHILSDEKAKLPAFSECNPLRFPFECATKTGTSKDFRDNWVVGYTTEWVVGVWVGNFDATPMEGVSGITGAGPIFREVMLVLSESGAPEPFAEPLGLVHLRVCPRSGELVGPNCPSYIEEIYLPGTEPTDPCSVHRLYLVDERDGLLADEITPSEFVQERAYEVYPLRYHSWMRDHGIPLPIGRDAGPLIEGDQLSVSFPDNGDVFKIDPILRREYQKILLHALVPSGVKTVSWLVDGEAIAEVSYPFTAEWELSPGRHSLAVRGAGGESESVEILVLR